MTMPIRFASNGMGLRGEKMQEAESIMLSVFLIGICLIALILYLIWIFIESAVKSGTEKAMRNVLKEYLIKNKEGMTIAEYITANKAENKDDSKSLKL